MPSPSRSRLSTIAVAALACTLGGIPAAHPSHADTTPVSASLSVASDVSISSGAVTADISSSEAPAGATYTISWGDGAQTTTTDKDTPVPHTYTRVGTFNVDLKVTASDGTDETSSRLSVTPVGGTITESAINLVNGTPVTLTIIPPSQLGPGETVTSYNFYLTCEPSQGTPQNTPAERPHSHPAATTSAVNAGLNTTVTQSIYCIGQVIVGAEATLNDGGIFWLSGSTLTVTAAPPVLVATVTQSAPRTVQVDLTGSTVDAVASSYPMFSINWGDGTSTNGGIGSPNPVAHLYDSSGTKTLTIWIGDHRGSSATTTRTITLTDPPSVTATVTTVAGRDRYATGIEASQRAFPAPGSANAVVLARGDQFADALTGIPLATYRHAPLLVTPGGPTATLDSRVATEIQRVLGPGTGKTIYVLGGTAALPQSMADYITNTLHYRVVRYSGTNRYATALTIAKTGLDNPGHIIAARGDDFADALTAGPLAADKLIDPTGKPAAIVLTQGPADHATVDAATAAYIRTKETIPGAVTAIGGGAMAALLEPTFHGTGPVTGIAGANRYASAAAVASNWGSSTQNKYTVGLATGTGFADALTGGALITHVGGPLLLTAPTVLSPETGRYIHTFNTSIALIDVFGGPNAIAPTAVNAIYNQLYTVY